MSDIILSRLKADTQLQHEQTESLLYARQIMAGSLSRVQYEHLLVIHYLFHQALETAVATQKDFFRALDVGIRQKTPWLAADLVRISLPLPVHEPHLFAGWNGYQLLGAMYVAEGSMLGGRVIARALSNIPELAQLAGESHFFGGYGDRTGSLWKAFGLYLTEKTNGHDDEIIEAAAQSFSIFRQLAKG